MQDLGGQGCALNHPIIHSTLNTYLLCCKITLSSWKSELFYNVQLLQAGVKFQGFLFLVKLHFVVICTSQIPCAFCQTFIKARGG